MGFSPWPGKLHPLGLSARSGDERRVLELFNLPRSILLDLFR